MQISHVDLSLARELRDHHSKHASRYTAAAQKDLLRILFRSLTANKSEYLRALFPDGPPSFDEWKLSEAQGGVEGAEYTEAARGKRCGHVFRVGEASYRCLTCSTDETCALCSRCFDASDHTGHKHHIFISQGNGGCCDCGDDEAFRIPVNCAIHTDLKGKDREDEEKPQSKVPEDLKEAVRVTIARAMDFMLDVISCSPEQLRLAKTEESIRHDEYVSRLEPQRYGGVEEAADEEFAVVLWNDEKHTITDVQNQVARACKETSRFGMDRANETNDYGRTIIKYSQDLPALLKVSKQVEQIRVTVTIRSARDTYREQMCGTIIEWLTDIAQCHVLDDNILLRLTVCEQMLRSWERGSGAANADIGLKGIDKHGLDEIIEARRSIFGVRITPRRVATEANGDDDGDGDGDDDDEIDELDEDDHDGDEDMGDGMDDMDGDEVVMEMDDMDTAALTLERLAAVIEAGVARDETGDVEMTDRDDELEVNEATLAGYPRPPLPPADPGPRNPGSETAGSTHGDQTEDADRSANPHDLRHVKIPPTPGLRVRPSQKPGGYWEIKPSRYYEQTSLPHEDLSYRTRVDWMILFDLRLWKKARDDVRQLCLGTVINVPEFKRILGLRFAALYTALAQLYLVADREPDHSVINLSLQIVTTPSITEEVMERGNFLTNVMAIIYTFLTTRQVGEPREVDPHATMALESGAMANRRLYHFFYDLRYLLPSEHVQNHICTDRQYLMQFLDLIKLPQGICPNVRAVGEHVEYETDTWFSASILMREINRIIRAFCDAFRSKKAEGDPRYLTDAISSAAVSTMFNSLGVEKNRFEQAEIKELTRFKSVPFNEFEIASASEFSRHRIVDFVVEDGSLSFHHPLHYTVSWLIECGRSMPVNAMRDILLEAAQRCKTQLNNHRLDGRFDTVQADDIVFAMFDFPLRLCAWLAQVKAGMWVRNGLSLRHQMTQYRSVLSRDLAYCRDLFMLQTAFVICDPSRFLANVGDRFGVSEWMKGDFATREKYDDIHHVEIAEEFLHLLILLITERSSIIAPEDEEQAMRDVIASDIAHTLCFKPLTYTELTSRIGDRIVDADDFQEVLGEVAQFRAPDGLSDNGKFELKPEYIAIIDPYSAQYTKNQRDEAENVHKQWISKKTGTKAAEVVYEPNLKPIPEGVYADLTKFTQTPLFAFIVHRLLEYCTMHKVFSSNIESTRVESLLHILLHLVLLAAKEDHGSEDDPARDPNMSFTSHALSKHRSCQAGDVSIFSLLRMASTVSEFESCVPQIRHILTILKEKRAKTYAAAMVGSSLPGVEAEDSAAAAEDAKGELEEKKKKALERQAKIMAQFQQQQQNFMSNQDDIDWSEEEDDEKVQESGEAAKPKVPVWKYPTGNCVFCRESVGDSRLYGTFAYFCDSTILRQTDLDDPAYVREVLNTPASLDRSAENIRPFGVAGENREKVRRLDSTGGEVISEKQGLGRGFPSNQNITGPLTTGCGHLMHYSCFGAYFAASQRRHGSQVARSHPERIKRKEFVCPLCKALGNAFLPIIWKGKEESHPGVLQPQGGFTEFLNNRIGRVVSRSRSRSLLAESDKLSSSGFQSLFTDYVAKNIVPPLSTKINQLVTPPLADPIDFASPPQPPMPGIFPVGEEFAGPLHPVPAADDDSVDELVSVYTRLKDTLKINKIGSRFDKDYSADIDGSGDELIYTDALIKTFGFSISSVEIAHRGVGAEPGKTLLDSVPEMSLTHLRILAETVKSYSSIGGLHGGSGRTVHEFRQMHQWKLCQLFLGHDGMKSQHHVIQENNKMEPLFGLDVFVFLAECSLSLVPVLNVDIMHIVRLCYIAEIVKAIYSCILRSNGLVEQLGDARGQGQAMDEDATDKQLLDAMQIFNWITTMHHKSLPGRGSSSPSSLVSRDRVPPAHILKSFHTIAAKYALPFLRKAAIMMHVQYGITFPDTGSEFADMSELDRLTASLRLPSIDKILGSFGKGEPDNQLEALAAGWITHWNIFCFRDGGDQTRVPGPSLSHPAIFELVGLPTHYDVLLDEANLKRCPATGKELTDPYICLFCAEIFCGQAVCCMQGRLGGCNTHMAKCVEYSLLPVHGFMRMLTLQLPGAAKTSASSSTSASALCSSCTPATACICTRRTSTCTAKWTLAIGTTAGCF